MMSGGLLYFMLSVHLLTFSTATTTLNSPTQTWGDTSCQVYIVDSGSCVIRKYNTTDSDEDSNTVVIIGSGDVPGFAGDNGKATSATLSYPYNIWGTTTGTLYVADLSNNRIRAVDHASQIIVTVVGSSSTGGYSGDGIAATSAKLFGPAAVTGGDTAENVYIGDTSNNRVRRFNSVAGIIHAVAGLGGQGFNGDGIPATSANLYNPYGLWLNTVSDALFVVDTLNNMVRKIDLSSGTIYAFAGLSGTIAFNGDGIQATSANLKGPIGACTGDNTAGSVVVTDAFNSRIRSISLSTGIITTIVGTGVPGYSGEHVRATAALIRNSYGVWVSTVGEIFVGDTFNSIARRVNASGIVSTILGFTPAITTLPPVATPTTAPSLTPTLMPSLHPTAPTVAPTAPPSAEPTHGPTSAPTGAIINNTYSIILIVLPFAAFFVYWYIHRTRSAAIIPYAKETMAVGDEDSEGQYLHCAGVTANACEGDADVGVVIPMASIISDGRGGDDEQDPMN